MTGCDGGESAPAPWAAVPCELPDPWRRFVIGVNAVPGASHGRISSLLLELSL